jgi:nucleoside-diphosphate kinase
VNMETTFLMVKPDGVQRQLVGEIISRFERKGFQMIGGKMMVISTELAEKHYGEHKGKPFFNDLVNFITSGPVFAMIWKGEDVVATARQMMGATDPKNAAPGTIRGDYGAIIRKNIIHGSDSLKSAEREINLFFNESERVEYERVLDKWTI